ncbi:MAG: GNAT family protein [Pyrinomonadaceae bacterium]
MSVEAIELVDGEIVVRPYRVEDIPALYEAARESIPELSVWMPWCHPDYSIDESRSFILSRAEAWKRDAEYGFGIFAQVSGRYLGGVGLNFVNRNHDLVNLGYWVRSSATGRGIASSATRLVARFAFERLGFQRVEILAATGNVASQRVAEKAGAVKEAVLRKRLRLHGKPVDGVLYSLVAEDLMPSSASGTQ